MVWRIKTDYCAEPLESAIDGISEIRFERTAAGSDDEAPDTLIVGRLPPAWSDRTGPCFRFRHWLATGRERSSQQVLDRQRRED